MRRIARELTSKIWPYERREYSKSRIITYLNQAAIIPGNEQLSIVTNKAASCDIFESSDGLDDFLCPWGIYVHSRGCSDRIFMRFGECKMNRSNGSIFLDKDGAFERPPISGFYAMFFWSRLCMFTWDDGLVIHTDDRQALSRSKSLFLDHVLIGTFDRFSRSFLSILFSFAYKMLLYQDILTGDEMFSDAFPMCVPSWFVCCCFVSNVPSKQRSRRHRLRGRLSAYHDQSGCRCRYWSVFVFFRLFLVLDSNFVFL